MLDAHYYGDLSGHNWVWEAGLIAQDVLLVDELKKFVGGGDTVDASGNESKAPYHLNYTSIFTYALAGIKELHTKFKAQEIELTSTNQELISTKQELTLVKNALNNLLTELGKNTI